jgi:hypothetical protein
MFICVCDRDRFIQMESIDYFHDECVHTFMCVNMDWMWSAHTGESHCSRLIGADKSHQNMELIFNVKHLFGSKNLRSTSNRHIK